MNQRGVALIQVLLIAAVLSAVATQLAYRQQASVRAAIGWFDQRQGLAWLQSTESLGLAELRRHATEPFPAEYWGEWSDPFELEEGGTAVFRLDRLNGRYNLNWLHASAGVEPAAEQVERLLAQNGEDPAWLDRLVGWLNAEQGADLSYRARDPGYRASGIPIAHASELNLLEDQFIPLSDFNEADWAVFLPPSSRLDLAQVSRNMLDAVWPELTDDQWASLEELRGSGNLSTVDDWLSHTTFEEATPPPAEWFSVGNQYFRFQGVIEFRERLFWQTSWIYRGTSGKLQVMQRHRLPFASPLTDGNGILTE